MLTVEDALKQLLADVRPVTETETVDLFNAHRRVLAAAQQALIDVPPADVSAMDGYAFHSSDADWLRDTGLPISQRIPAGVAPTKLSPGSAARLFTGSEIPGGADTVAIQENCSLQGNTVTCRELPKPGSHIRPRGQDIRRGSDLFPAGYRLRAQDLGLLASVGIAAVAVFRRLTVGVLSTGDELTQPGQLLAPGKIYNSNRFSLYGLLESLNINMLDLGHVGDNLDATVAQLKSAAHRCDALITTGGVSVGEEDHVKQAVESLGTLDLWKLAIKPGKPFAYGRIDGTPFLGLPGNPVAVFVTFLILVRPYLLALQNAADTGMETVHLPAAFAIEKPNSRQEYLRVRIHRGRIERFHSQDSGVLSSTRWANALAVVPRDTTVKQNDKLEVIPFSQFSL